ncbi:MAG: hypothetical protein PHV02_14070 [Rhodocyclaceae bacterium]|nr:hypothetical protein [Rhodocyclaceae bacterium]
MNERIKSPEASSQSHEVEQLHERIAALETKCALLSASLNQADKENDKLRRAVTDSEGGEL